MKTRASFLLGGYPNHRTIMLVMNYILSLQCNKSCNYFMQSTRLPTEEIKNEPHRDGTFQRNNLWLLLQKWLIPADLECLQTCRVTISTLLNHTAVGTFIDIFLIIVIFCFHFCQNFKPNGPSGILSRLSFYKL